MPIIINEFEIIPEVPAEPARELPQQRERAPSPPPPDPSAILRLERVHRERMRRVRAT